MDDYKDIDELRDVDIPFWMKHELGFWTAKALMKEYDLIKQKKSKLSLNSRNKIVAFVEATPTVRRLLHFVK